MLGLVWDLCWVQSLDEGSHSPPVLLYLVEVHLVPAEEVGAAVMAELQVIQALRPSLNS